METGGQGLLGKTRSNTEPVVPEGCRAPRRSPSAAGKVRREPLKPSVLSLGAMLQGPLLGRPFQSLNNQTLGAPKVAIFIPPLVSHRR